MKNLTKNFKDICKSGAAFLCAASMLTSLMAATVIPTVAFEAQSVAGVDVNQAPMQTVYDSPATDWQSETLPLGNGFIGASVWGGVDSEEILINEHTLWSGGPGANIEYDGGMSEASPELIKNNLKSAREELASVLSNFSANYTPGIGAANTQNYPSLSSELSGWIESLKGEKENFGSYQELGRIHIDDSLDIMVDAYVTNCYCTDVSELFDGVKSDKNKWFSADGAAFGDETVDNYPIDLVVRYAEPKAVAEYALTTSNDSVKYKRNPTAWSFYGSNDGKEWTLLDEVTDPGFSANWETLTFTLDEGAFYSYYKWTFTDHEDGGWGIQLGEVELFESSFDSAYGENCWNNDYDAKEGVANLFDGDTSTKWYSGAGTSGTPYDDQYDTLFIKYTSPYTINSYSMTMANDSIKCNRDPVHWKMYGSNDDGGSWTLIDEFDAKERIFTSEYQKKTFSLSEPVSYKWYKFEFIELSGSSNYACGVQFSELSLDRITDEAATNYKRMLDIDNAVASVSYNRGNVAYNREYFVSNPGNFMAALLTASEDGKLTKLIRFTTPQTKATITAEGDTITITGWPADHDEEEKLLFAAQIKVVTDGKLSVISNFIRVEDATRIELYMTAGTNYQQCMDDSFDYFSDEDPLDGVKARLAALEGKTYEELKAAHVADYKELYDRVKLDLGGTAQPAKYTDDLLTGYKNGSNTAAENRYLEALYYQFGRYLLIASSREGSLPANLQGIWGEGLSMPWNSDYHTNINIQMNYWLAEQTNLAECHLPMINYINSLVERGKITANTYHYNVSNPDEEVRGWTTYHENNIWGDTAPGIHGTAFYFPTAAAWLAQDIWEQYAFSLDKDLLAESYDTLKGAALFWVDNLMVDPRDGTLVSGPSYSPEHGPFSLGTSCDQAIIWEVFNNTLKAAEVMGDTSTEIQEIKTAMSKLSLPTIGVNGQYMEWKDEITLDVTGDNKHRHVNQLFALHPGTLVVANRSEEDDAFIEAMKKTLETRGDGGTGWSKAWKINFWARLRDGDHAGLMVNQILKESTYNNLYDAHPPFQIDGNFGATAGMTEMFLQSQGDAIELLPALPSMWYGSAVSGVRARGNVEADIQSAADGTLEKAVLRAGSDNAALKVSAEGLGNYVVVNSDGESVDVNRIDNDTITFAAEAGESYTLVKGDSVTTDPCANGHTEVIDAAVAPTCTESGLTEGKHCSVCNEVVVAQEEIPELGHDWVDATTQAPKTCNNCGATEGEKLNFLQAIWLAIIDFFKKLFGIK